MNRFGHGQSPKKRKGVRVARSRGNSAIARLLPLDDGGVRLANRIAENPDRCEHGFDVCMLCGHGTDGSCSAVSGSVEGK